MDKKKAMQEALREQHKEELIALVEKLRDKLEKKESSIERMKRNLKASRRYNSKLQEKVLHLRTKVVDYYRLHPGQTD